MTTLWTPGQPAAPDPALVDDRPPVLTGVPHDGVASDLPWTDRLRLRIAAKRALVQAGCPKALITDAEADKYINALLRPTAEKMIRAVVDAGLHR